jgi:hypothetical protein
MQTGAQVYHLLMHCYFPSNDHYITCADLRIKVTINNNLYSFLFPDTSTYIIERNAVGWLKAGYLEPHWVDRDIATIGTVGTPSSFLSLLDSF